MYIIQLNNITKNFSEVTAVNDISLNVSRGSVMGLVGPNGAGKTTIVNILTGIIKPNSGTARICSINTMKRSVELKMKLSIVLEDPIFLENLLVKEHLELINVLYEINSKESVQHVMKQWDIEKYKNKKLSTLSKGNRKRVALVTAFIRNFEVLIMDEPFKELDIYGRKLLEKEIEKFKQNNKTILITSHELFQIHKLCDELAFLKDGVLIKQRSINKIQNDIDGGLYRDFEDFVYNSLGE